MLSKCDQHFASNIWKNRDIWRNSGVVGNSGKSWYLKKKQRTFEKSGVPGKFRKSLYVKERIFGKFGGTRKVRKTVIFEKDWIDDFRLLFLCNSSSSFPIYFVFVFLTNSIRLRLFSRFNSSSSFSSIQLVFIFFVYLVRLRLFKSI